MIVLVDCDGVMADFLGGVCHGLGLDPKDCSRYDIEEAYRLPPGTLQSIAHEPGFCASLAPIPCAQTAIRTLRSRGHRVVAVTSPWWSSPYWMFERTAWLSKYFGFNPKDVIQGSRKALIRGDVLVEDNISTAHEWLDAWPDGHAFLFDMPYNQGPTTATRVGTWEPILKHADSAWTIHCEMPTVER